MFAKVYAKHCKGYASQLVNNRSGLTTDDNLKDCVLDYLAAVKSRMLKEPLDSWGALPDLASILTFQEHMVSYVCT